MIKAEFTRRLATCVLAVSLAPCAGAATIQVASCGNDAWSGQLSECVSPTGPKQTIQSAIEIARDGDTVRVQLGVYDGPIDFDGKAIRLVSVSGPLVTILKATGGDPIVRCDSHEGADSVLQGFGVQSGHAVGGSGGGMYVSGSSPTIIDCRFTSNRADVNGGGLWLHGSESTISDCVFESNQAEHDGGAIYVSGGSVVFDDCHIRFNVATRGAGIANIGAEVELRDSTLLLGQATVGGGLFNEGSVVRLLRGSALGNFVSADGGSMFSVASDVEAVEYQFNQNRSQGRGGGISHDGGHLDMDDCQIAANTAIGGGGLDLRFPMTALIADSLIAGNDGNDEVGKGGGVLISPNEGDGGGSLSVVRTCFSFNHASEGGAVYADAGSLFATNCLLETNEAAARGGALFTSAQSSVLTNCTVVRNTSPVGAAAYAADGELIVRNAILWENIGAALQGDGAIDVQYSDIEGGYEGTGNIIADPSFVDPDHRDYHINSDSMCIDAADNGALPRGTSTDLDGAARLIDDRETVDTGTGGCPVVDMGAYEFAAGGMLCCDGDIDGNDDVDFSDILRVLRAWGNRGGSEDVDGSGVVDLGDITLILSRWGPCVA